MCDICRRGFIRAATALGTLGSVGMFSSIYPDGTKAIAAMATRGYPNGASSPSSMRT